MFILLKAGRKVKKKKSKYEKVRKKMGVRDAK